ncbi:GntR family transcriptional regulator, partial [Klebsiella pneumoniae]
MKKQSTSLIPTQFANQQIYKILRQDIVRCEIKPGTLLSEKEVSERFDVSRQPVREAFIKLAENGLIQIRPQRGSYVRKISLSRVKEFSFVRQAIESEIARSATLLVTKQQIEQLEENLSLQNSCITKTNALDFFNIDDDFH